MSVNDLAAALRRVMALQPTAELQHAAMLLDEAHTIIAALADGSHAPDLLSAVAAWNEARSTIWTVQQACHQVQELLERYLVHLGAAGGHTGTALPTSPPRPFPPAPVQPAATRSPDPALIAEVQRHGHKITPERVVRIGRTREGRVVWLEEGDEESGRRHFMEPDRVADFQRFGIRKEDIVGAVFAAVTTGTPLGISGKNRIIYSTRYGGREQWIAVSVGSNGYIVGANPISMNRKLKPLP